VVTALHGIGDCDQIELAMFPFGEEGLVAVMAGAIIDGDLCLDHE
jgi:hypothetical protein